MSKKRDLERETRKVSLREIPKKCHKELPSIAKQYFDGVPRESLKFELSKKCKEYVDLMYDRLEQEIISDSFGKMRGVIVGHPNDFKEAPVFTDAIIRYCIDFGNLKKEIFKVIDCLDKKNKACLNRRYETGVNLTEDRYALKALYETKEFRGLLRDKFILNKK